ALPICPPRSPAPRASSSAPATWSIWAPTPPATACSSATRTPASSRHSPNQPPPTPPGYAASLHDTRGVALAMGTREPALPMPPRATPSARHTSEAGRCSELPHYRLALSPLRPPIHLDDDPPRGLLPISTDAVLGQWRWGLVVAAHVLDRALVP